MSDLVAAQQQEQRDTDGAKYIHQGRTHAGGGDRTQIGAQQTLRGGVKPRHFPGFHAEGFHDAVAGNRFLDDVLNVG